MLLHLKVVINLPQIWLLLVPVVGGRGRQQFRQTAAQPQCAP